jgi:hypothetical protein
MEESILVSKNVAQKEREKMLAILLPSSITEKMGE